MEIERKFLVPDLPENLSRYSSHEIEQAYLCRDPVVRVRRRDDMYFLTVKGGGKMVRQEFELPLSQASYEQLKAKAEGNVIRKKRILIPLEPYTVELDLFEEPFHDLAMAEVEFPSVEEALAFEPPAWMSREVTDDVRFHNSNMSCTRYKNHSFFGTDQA